MADVWSSSRLIYRAVEPSDDPFIHSIHADSESFTNTRGVIPKPQDEAGAKGRREFMSNQALIGVVICLNQESAKPIPVGLIDLTAPEARRHHRHATIGINILAEFQGKGYGSEAIQWILRWGFCYGNLHRIEIGAFEWNTGALKLYEKLGFIPESRKRDLFWHNGRYWDEIGMAMLDTEWREKYGEKNGA